MPIREFFLLLLITRVCWSAVQVDLITREAGEFGPPSNRNASEPELSANGRWLVFASDSELVVTNRTKPGVVNLFLRDNETGRVTLVTPGTNATPADGHSYGAIFSSDSSKLFFQSDAKNLATGNSRTAACLYLHDLLSSTTAALNISGISFGSFSITADGRYIVYESDAPLSELDTNSVTDLYRYDVSTEVSELVSFSFDNNSAAGGGPFEPSISDDGRYITYVSSALSVVPNLNGTPQPNFYLRDMLNRTNVLLTKDDSGNVRGYGNRTFGTAQSGISADGRWALFTSAPFRVPNLVKYNNDSLYQYDVRSNSLAWFRAEYPKAPIGQLKFSGNSQFLTFAQGDRLYIKNLATDENQLITSADTLVTNLAPTEVVFSRNGRFLLFQSAEAVTSTNKGEHQFYAFDQDTRRIRLIGASADGQGPNEPILSISVSDTGWVAFASFASNLGDDTSRGSDVFLQNLLDESAPIICVSTPLGGVRSATPHGRSWAEPGALSADGRYVVFTSEDSALAMQHTNHSRNLFIHDAFSRTNRAVSFTLEGQPRTNATQLIGVSADATAIAYFSRENDEKFNSIFVYRTVSGQTTRENILPNGDQTSVDSRAALSGDGRLLAFCVGNQLFVRNLAEQRTQFATLVNAKETIQLSPSGKYIVRIEVGSQIGVVDWKEGTTWYRQFDLFPAATQISFSGDESRMTFIGRTRNSLSLGHDLYVFDPVQQSLLLAATNAVPPAALSSNGSTLLFQMYEGSSSNRSIRIQMHNLANGKTTTLPLDYSIPFQLRGDSFMSDDARFILVSAPGARPSLAANWHEWHLYDAALATLTPLRLESLNEDGNGPMGRASLSADGRTITFSSMASDLVPLDLNLQPDIFLARVSIIDTNRNGIDDGWEALHLLASIEPEADLDGDGMSTRAEYYAGTDPGDPQSTLRIDILEDQDNQPFAMWNSIRGKRYSIEFTSEPGGAKWQRLGDLVTAIRNKSQTRLPNPTEARRFFRISLAD